MLRSVFFPLSWESGRGREISQPRHSFVENIPRRPEKSFEARFAVQHGRGAEVVDDFKEFFFVFPAVPREGAGGLQTGAGESVFVQV